MKFSTVFLFVAAIIFAVMIFSPEAEARIPRRKRVMIRRLALLALLKGPKKIVMPLPLPLPLPLPVVQKTLMAEPEPMAIAEPVAMAEPSYGGASAGLGYGGAGAVPAFGGGGY